SARGWLGTFGVEALAPRRPRGLSGGEQLRVGLSRALAADPALLLLDEPADGLDPLARRQLRDILRRLGRFFAHESCGKCFPCRIGTQRLAERLGLGRAQAPHVLHQRGQTLRVVQAIQALHQLVHRHAPMLPRLGSVEHGPFGAVGETPGHPRGRGTSTMAGMRRSASMRVPSGRIRR
ncbi:MAG: ATP-binding cassette domain-containing protein, partial [Myxococcales bacterium]|nr:ATP-binding cassette domain-containing protein [Myxococcales bacterium]